MQLREPLSPFSTSSRNDVARQGCTLKSIGSGVAGTAQFLKSWRILEFPTGETILTLGGKAAELWPVRCGGLVLKAALEALQVNLPAASVLLVTVALPLGRLEESGFPGDQFVVRR